MCNKQNVGCNMKPRYSNNKSHIKNKVKNCILAALYNETIDDKLNIELKVTLIDKVMPKPSNT